MTVSVNWHELRILCIWAENWQRERMTDTRTVYAIADRLAQQHPERMPLTLAREIGELADHFPGVQVSDPRLRQDIAEQTGHEVDLP